uniref:Uncharacterized protein n=1 Tax=Zea mays TaxID=4577 RepID=A0A804UKZ5_MAIZE
MRPALSSTSSSRFPFHPRRSSANTSRRSGSPVRSRDGEWLRLRVGPRGGFQRRTRRHLRQVLLHSVVCRCQSYHFWRLYPQQVKHRGETELRLGGSFDH